MTPRVQALFVHLLTATGAVLAMLAMLAAADQKWDPRWTHSRFSLCIAFA